MRDLKSKLSDSFLTVLTMEICAGEQRHKSEQTESEKFSGTLEVTSFTESFSEFHSEASLS